MGMVDLSKDLFNNSLFEEPTRNTDGFEIYLVEDDRDSKLKKVTVSGVSGTSILLKMDKVNSADVLFQDALGKRRRCDYVLLSESGSTKHLIFIELKCDKSCGCAPQFKGAEAIIDYAESILEKFHNSNNVFGTAKRHFVKFYFDKFAKYERPQKPNIKRENVRKIGMQSVGDISFRGLI